GKMFQGSSLVMGPRGDTRARGPVWDEALLTASVDLDDITRARADAPLLSDLRTALPALRGELDRAFEGRTVPADDERPATRSDAPVRPAAARVTRGADGGPSAPL